ncbi:MAG: zinc ribbon domain-containing protein [Bacteroidaceae bacterium]|nr:zinc ribbon domain-containing protein [Bacteroidaceae bacterium]
MPNKICPICHSEIPEDSKFCFVCGSNLENGAVAPNQQTQNQQQHHSAPQNVAQMPPQQQPPYMPNNLSGNNGNGKGPNKGMIALIAFAIAALVAIIILLTLLLSRGSDKAEPIDAPSGDSTVTKTDTVYQTVVQQPAPEPVYRPTFQEGGTFKFSGSIPGAGGIRMTLTNSGGSVSGTYYYTKVGSPIYLSGSLSGNRLYLSSQYDSWEGTISGRRYSGTMYVYETGRTFRFNTRY